MGELEEGDEIRKTRPALVLKNDIANKFSPVTIMAAIGCVAIFKKRPENDGSSRPGSVSCSHPEQLVDELNLLPNIRMNSLSEENPHGRHCARCSDARRGTDR